MAEHTVIGTRLAKVDGPERVTGKAAFGADLSLPNMLWAKLVRSPYSHARIKKIDPSKALALPGVKAVICADDLPPLAKGTTAPLVGEVSIDMSAIRELVMASDKARYHGQAVAAVAATDPFTAEEAAELVEVESANGLPARGVPAPGLPFDDGGSASNKSFIGSRCTRSAGPSYSPDSLRPVNRCCDRR